MIEQEVFNKIEKDLLEEQFKSNELELRLNAHKLEMRKIVATLNSLYCSKRKWQFFIHKKYIKRIKEFIEKFIDENRTPSFWQKQKFNYKLGDYEQEPIDFTKLLSQMKH